MSIISQKINVKSKTKKRKKILFNIIFNDSVLRNKCCISEKTVKEPSHPINIKHQFF